MGAKKKTKVRTHKKLETDFLNTFFKFIAIMANPWLAIILFSASLWFSYQHNAVHIYGIENKPLTDPEQEAHRINKRRIILARMGFDALGLVFSIIALGVELAYAAYQLESVRTALLIVAAVGLTASSIMSTLHKIYRFFKPGYDETWYARDTFRVVFGAAGTVILAGLLFHFIPKTMVSHPVVLAGTILIMLGLGIHKIYRIYVEREEYAKRLHTIENVSKKKLSSVASQKQLNLFVKIEKDGDLNFKSIVDIRIEDILRLLLNEDVSSAGVLADHALVKNFFETLDVDVDRVMKVINRKFSSQREKLERCITEIMDSSSGMVTPEQCSPLIKGSMPPVTLIRDALTRTTWLYPLEWRRSRPDPSPARAQNLNINQVTTSAAPPVASTQVPA